MNMRNSAISVQTYSIHLGEIMNIKRLTLVVALILVVALAVSVVSAQGGSREPRPQHRADVLRDALVEQTGLEWNAIIEQLRNGATLVDILAEEGADVDAFAIELMADMEANFTSAVEDGQITQEQADRALENIEEQVTRALNGGFRPQLPNRQDEHSGADQLFGLLLGAAAEKTGLEPEAITEQLREGTSLTAILIDAGVDVEVFTDDVIARMEADLIEQISRMLDQEGLRPRPGGGRPAADQLFSRVRDAIVEQTGLAPEAIMEELRDGVSFAGIMTVAGVDVDAFVSDLTSQVEAELNQAVADGRMEEERAAQFLETLNERLADLINRHPEGNDG
jgi:hypothetical protein